MTTKTDSQPSDSTEANKSAGGDCVSRLVLPLRVWWVPQMPMEPFYFAVDSIHEARKILDTLAAYDLFQWQKKVKPDYANTGGLEVFEDGEWVEWESADGDDIDSLNLRENDERVHHYQRGRASIIGLGLWSGKGIENERLVVVVTARLVRSFLVLLPIAAGSLAVSSMSR